MTDRLFRDVDGYYVRRDLPDGRSADVFIKDVPGLTGEQLRAIAETTAAETLSNFIAAHPMGCDCAECAVLR